VLTRFTSDGTAKDYATVAPDGKRAAYAKHSVRENEHYWVADAGGTQVQFPVYTAKAKADTDYDALGPLMGLRWSSNHVLRLVKHVSPTASRFEFHRIGRDLTGTARMIGAPAYGDGCTMRRHSHHVACVRGDVVTIDGREIFQISEFAGKTPTASFTLTKGASVMTPGSPSFKVQVVGFYKNTVGLKITYPNGNGGQMYVPDDMPLTVPGVNYHYAFFAKLTDAKTGLVRVDEIIVPVKDSETFFPAIAWLPHGHGLLLVRRSDAGSSLDLIRPRRHGGHDHKAHHKMHQWRLAASVPINVDGSIQNMRFITPGMLLLQESGQAAESEFMELPVRIDRAHGQAPWTMTVGAVQTLPDTIPVTTNGKTTQAPVLDWSCQAHHHQ
jgi:hypothetical protein